MVAWSTCLLFRGGYRPLIVFYFFMYCLKVAFKVIQFKFTYPWFAWTFPIFMSIVQGSKLRSHQTTRWIPCLGRSAARRICWHLCWLVQTCPSSTRASEDRRRPKVARWRTRFASLGKVRTSFQAGGGKLRSRERLSLLRRKPWTSYPCSETHDMITAAHDLFLEKKSASPRY